MSTWEERMAERHRGHRLNEKREQRQAWLWKSFGSHWGVDDPDEIPPEILAARLLGLSYGDPGPRLPADACRQCWGERHVWLGNTWGVQHKGGTMSGCQHACHNDEIWLAS